MDVARTHVAAFGVDLGQVWGPKTLVYPGSRKTWDSSALGSQAYSATAGSCCPRFPNIMIGTWEHQGSSLINAPSTPYEFLGSGAMDVTNSWKFLCFGDIHGPKPYKFTRLRWALISQTPVLLERLAFGPCVFKAV